MLEVMGVTKKYGKVLANDNVTFTIPDGNIVVLLGPNGAGKSTIIKSIAGLLKFDGAIRVNGHHNKSLEAKRILGYIPEIPALYQNLTVKEHLEFVARAYRLKDYKAYADELLERMELADKKNKFGDELSKGMQQKLSICCGLLPRPQIVLFDEPMIGLDPHAIKEVKLMFEELRNQGASLLVSTHMIDSVDMLWNETVIMQTGKVQAVVNKNQLGSSGESLEELFFKITEGTNREMDYLNIGKEESN